jgi:hypothetical protein
MSGGERVTSHADWEREATRFYAGESKARMIAAAETVLRNSDPGDISFEYRASGFTARRKYFYYAVFASADGEDRWSFYAGENKTGAKATVYLVDRMALRTVAGDGRSRVNQRLIGTFRLFYARMDYVLGRRHDWPTCQGAPASLAVRPDQPGLDGLCSPTHQASAVVPAQLGPPPKRPKAPNAAESEVSLVTPELDDVMD